MNAANNGSSFAQMAATNVNEHVEKKNGLSYLSWPWAVDQLLRADPTATWDYRDFSGNPHLTLADGTAMVFCTVTAFGQSRTMQLPVMDHRNRAITNPDAFAVNTAMQRCLVKAVALHGLGLYIYAGEETYRKVTSPSRSRRHPRCRLHRSAGRASRLRSCVSSSA